MSNFRYILFYALTFVSCATSRTEFDASYLTPAFFDNAAELAMDRIDKKLLPIISDSIVSIMTYEAVLEEKIVARHSISDYKLINIRSEQETLDLENERGHHCLYFSVLTMQSKTKIGVFVAAAYNSSGLCQSIKPAYIGFMGSGGDAHRFVTQRELKVKGRSNGLYLGLNRKAAPSIELDFVADTSFVPGNRDFRVIQILQKSKNKLTTDNQVLVFDIEEVFHDVNALLFTRIN